MGFGTGHLLAKHQVGASPQWGLAPREASEPRKKNHCVTCALLLGDFLVITVIGYNLYSSRRYNNPLSTLVFTFVALPCVALSS